MKNKLIILLLLSISLLWSANLVVDGQTLVTNGDFSNGTTDWSTIRSTIAAVDGEIQITATSNLGDAIQDITVVAGNTYSISFNYWNTVGDLAQYAVYDNDTPSWLIARTQLTDTQILSSVTNSFTSPTGCTSVRIILEAKTNTDITYFDNIVVTDITNKVVIDNSSSVIKITN